MSNRQNIYSLRLSGNIDKMLDYLSEKMELKKQDLLRKLIMTEFYKTVSEEDLKEFNKKYF